MLCHILQAHNVSPPSLQAVFCSEGHRGSPEHFTKTGEHSGSGREIQGQQALLQACGSLGTPCLYGPTDRRGRGGLRCCSPVHTGGHLFLLPVVQGGDGHQAPDTVPTQCPGKAPWPLGIPYHQPVLSPLPMLWIPVLARSPDAPDPMAQLSPNSFFFPLVTHHCPRVSPPLTPSWAERLVCVCVCACMRSNTYASICLEMPEFMSPHGMGWVALPKDLRSSHPPSKPHGRVRDYLGL